MRKLPALAVAGILALAASMSPASATAATEFGDTCVANHSTEGFVVSIFEISAPGNSLPGAAPTSGVITQWKVNLISAPVSIPQTLKVLRPTGPNTAQVVGEASGTVVGGSNVFNTRIPVQTGDRLAIFGTSSFGTLFCEIASKSVLLGAYEGTGGGPGSTVSFIEFVEPARVPVSAVIEPDADNDGYGDETQDKCPQSASFQGECPKVKIDIGSVVKKKGSVVVALTATNEASVNVVGAVKLGKGKKAKLSGGKKTVKPGKITRFTLKFPANLKAAFGQLPHGRSLSLKVAASAKDLIGRVTKDQVKVKLKGQA
jgi:hypothetical protein